LHYGGPQALRASLRERGLLEATGAVAHAS
jgi:hypothetical protein